MRYPERGGYRSFIEPLIDGADISCNTCVTMIDPVRRIVGDPSGDMHGYANLVSTLPLPSLVAMMDNVPSAVRTAAETLFATSVDLVSIARRTAQVSPSLWFYIHDRDIMAARVYSPSFKSADNAPPGCGSLQFEIYASIKAPRQAKAAEMTENCLAAMERMGVARRDDVIFTHHKRLPYANVVFDLGMEARRDLVCAWVEAQGIRLAGRFGQWAYLWSNPAFISGHKAVLDILASG